MKFHLKIHSAVPELSSCKVLRKGKREDVNSHICMSVHAFAAKGIV
jgi:hypothetical protein